MKKSSIPFVFGQGCCRRRYNTFSFIWVLPIRQEPRDRSSPHPTRFFAIIIAHFLMKEERLPGKSNRMHCRLCWRSRGKSHAWSLGQRFRMERRRFCPSMRGRLWRQHGDDKADLKKGKTGDHHRIPADDGRCDSDSHGLPGGRDHGRVYAKVGMLVFLSGVSVHDFFYHLGDSTEAQPSRQGGALLVLPFRYSERHYRDCCSMRTF